MSIPTHGIRINDGGIWIRHRRVEYGPFDYEWSQDFAGLELHYQGQKCGEYCTIHEYFLDLQPYQLPAPVIRVATIVLGCIIESMRQGRPRTSRPELIETSLGRFGFARYQLLERPGDQPPAK